MLPVFAFGMVAISGPAASPIDSFVPHIIAPYMTHPMVLRANTSDTSGTAFDADAVAFVGRADAPFDERLAVLSTLSQRTVSVDTSNAFGKSLLGGPLLTAKIGGQSAEALALAGYLAAIIDKQRLTRAQAFVTAAKQRGPSSFAVGLVSALIDGHMVARAPSSWCATWQRLRRPLYDTKLETDVGASLLSHYGEVAFSARDVCGR